MAPLVATDEYGSALRAIASQAEIGLSAGPGQAEAALRAILMLCEKTARNVTEAFSHSDALRYKLADLLAEMPDGLPRVDGWDGL